MTSGSWLQIAALWLVSLSASPVWCSLCGLTEEDTSPSAASCSGPQPHTALLDSSWPASGVRADCPTKPSNHSVKGRRVCLCQIHFTVHTDTVCSSTVPAAVRLLQKRSCNQTTVKKWQVWSSLYYTLGFLYLRGNVLVESGFAKWFSNECFVPLGRRTRTLNVKGSVQWTNSTSTLTSVRKVIILLYVYYWGHSGGGVVLEFILGSGSNVLAPSVILK